MRWTLAFLPIVAACGYSTAYPDYQPHLYEDSGAQDTVPGTTGEPDVPCGQDGPVGQLMVVNQHTEAVALWEIAPNICGEIHIAILDVGDFWESSVVTGRSWVVRELDDDFVTWFGVPQGSQVDWVEYVP